MKQHRGKEQDQVKLTGWQQLKPKAIHGSTYHLHSCSLDCVAGKLTTAA